ncbi:FmdB family zinc ribbon protein [Caldimonas brevitalea]|uniref:FmdB family transcriptional regulator n=1 Tax=Caldimonas brevitalea TaxID=413882 RepID=A0A0G3BEU3_9BURK|nr:FmdB family zinc ribbon protein [Caldimonas brevitalea]AKJ27939.1 FmdB family transcriptional regulator [Caldimonas brevitalea]
MPIYAYRCESCGHAQDVLQKISDPLLTECPQCHAGTFKKQLTAAGFQLKGSGWYVTDFRNNGSSSGAAASAKPAGGGESAAAGTAAAGASAGTASASSSASSDSGGTSSSSGGCGTSCACH